MASEDVRNDVLLTPELHFGRRERCTLDDPDEPMNVYYYRRFSIVWELVLIPGTTFAAKWCADEEYGTPLIAGVWSLVAFEIVLFGLIMPIMTWESDEIDRNGVKIKTRRSLVGWVSRELVLEAEKCVDGCYDGRSTMRDPRFGDVCFFLPQRLDVCAGKTSQANL
jgi:hypothetical protein